MTSYRPTQEERYRTMTKSNLVLEHSAFRAVCKRQKKTIKDRSIILAGSLLTNVLLLLVVLITTAPEARAMQIAAPEVQTNIAQSDEPVIIMGPEKVVFCYDMGGGMISCFLSCTKKPKNTL